MRKESSKSECYLRNGACLFLSAQVYSRIGDGKGKEDIIEEVASNIMDEVSGKSGDLRRESLTVGINMFPVISARALKMVKKEIAAKIEKYLLEKVERYNEKQLPMCVPR